MMRSILKLRPPHSALRTLLILLFLAGCAHYSTSARAIPSHIRTVAVPLFENVTVEPGIKEPLTDAVIARFLQDNQLRVVDARDADAMIIGTIIDVREESLTFQQGQDTRETRIWIIASVRFEDVRERKVIWEEPRLSEWGVFQVVTGTDADRDPGIEQAIDKMAETILNRTIAGW